MEKLDKDLPDDGALELDDVLDGAYFNEGPEKETPDEERIYIRTEDSSYRRLSEL